MLCRHVARKDVRGIRMFAVPRQRKAISWYIYTFVWKT